MEKIQDTLYLTPCLYTSWYSLFLFSFWFLFCLIFFFFYYLSNQFLRKRVTSAVQILDLVHFLL